MIFDIFSFEFAQRALIASLLIGLVAPLVGTYLVQRRLALLGDGAGHVALTGVGLAILFGWAPIPLALLTAMLGTVLIELIRDRSKAAGDLALALVFYGGIAGGVFCFACPRWNQCCIKFIPFWISNYRFSRGFILSCLDKPYYCFNYFCLGTKYICSWNRYRHCQSARDPSETLSNGFSVLIRLDCGGGYESRRLIAS